MALRVSNFRCGSSVVMLTQLDINEKELTNNKHSSD